MDALITALNFPNSSKTRPTSKNQLTTDAMSEMRKRKKKGIKLKYLCLSQPVKHVDKTRHISAWLNLSSSVHNCKPC